MNSGLVGLSLQIQNLSFRVDLHCLYLESASPLTAIPYSKPRTVNRLTSHRLASAGRARTLTPQSTQVTRSVLLPYMDTIRASWRHLTGLTSLVAELCMYPRRSSAAELH